MPDPRFAHLDRDSTEPPAPRRPTKKGSGETKYSRSIAMMTGQPIFDLVALLRDLPVTGLNIGHLLDSSPQMRIELAKEMAYPKKTQTVVETNLVGCLDGNVSHCLAGVATSEQTLENGNKSPASDIIPEPTGKISNFYTFGLVELSDKMMRIPKILLDGGSVVNLMPLKLAMMLQVKLIPNNDLVIRTATNELRPITHMVVIVLRIAEVRTAIKVYLVDMVSTYSMLLGRRWLHQVRALGDYAKHSYTILDSQNFSHPVPRDEASRTFETVPYITKIQLAPGKDRHNYSLSDEEFEDSRRVSDQAIEGALEQVL